MDKMIIKVGDHVLEDYTRIEAIFNRYKETLDGPRLYIYRKKEQNSILESVYLDGQRVDIKFYEDQEALELDEPTDVYEDLLLVEWGFNINPPNYSFQEKAIFEFGSEYEDE